MHSVCGAREQRSLYVVREEGRLLPFFLAFPLGGRGTTRVVDEGMILYVASSSVIRLVSLRA